MNFELWKFLRVIGKNNILNKILRSILQNKTLILLLVLTFIPTYAFGEYKLIDLKIQAETVDMVTDNNNVVHLIWTKNDGIHYGYLRGTELLGDELIPDSGSVQTKFSHPQIGVKPDGTNIHITWSSGDTNKIMVASRENGIWKSDIVWDNNRYSVLGIESDIGEDMSGTVHMIFKEYDKTTDSISKVFYFYKKNNIWSMGKSLATINSSNKGINMFIDGDGGVHINWKKNTSRLNKNYSYIPSGSLFTDITPKSITQDSEINEVYIADLFIDRNINVHQIFVENETKVMYYAVNNSNSDEFIRYSKLNINTSTNCNHNHMDRTSPAIAVNGKGTPYIAWIEIPCSSKDSTIIKVSKLNKDGRWEDTILDKSAKFIHLNKLAMTATNTAVYLAWRNNNGMITLAIDGQIPDAPMAGPFFNVVGWFFNGTSNPPQKWAWRGSDFWDASYRYETQIVNYDGWVIRGNWEWTAELIRGIRANHYWELESGWTSNHDRMKFHVQFEGYADNPLNAPIMMKFTARAKFYKQGVTQYFSKSVMNYADKYSKRTVVVDGSDPNPEPTPEPEPGVPVPYFTATPKSGYAPLKVNFDASSSKSPNGAIVSWSWDFGNGTTATGKTATYTFNTAAIYKVTLTVTDSSKKSNSIAKTISVVQKNLPPFAYFTNTPETGLYPLTVAIDPTLSKDSDGKIVKYKWTFGDGTSSDKTSNSIFSHIYDKIGVYTLKLYAYDDDGDSNSYSQSVFVYGIEPPANVITELIENRTLFTIKYVYKITWDNSPLNINRKVDIIKYKVLRKLKNEINYQTIAEVESSTKIYNDRIGSEIIEFDYKIVAVDNEGRESN